MADLIEDLKLLIRTRHPLVTVRTMEESYAARQIREAHSRYRFYTHPRSIYNSPPRRYDYRGW